MTHRDLYADENLSSETLSKTVSPFFFFPVAGAGNLDF